MTGSSLVYYVYFHVHPETKELLYIGYGSYERAWNFKRFTSRSDKHSEELIELYDRGYTPQDWVVLHETKLEKKIAVELEKELIDKHRPRYNIASNKDIYKGTFSKEVRAFVETLRKLGYSYNTISYLCGGSDTTTARKNTKTMSFWRIINNGA